MWMRKGATVSDRGTLDLFRELEWKIQNGTNTSKELSYFLRHADEFLEFQLDALIASCGQDRIDPDVRAENFPMKKKLVSDEILVPITMGNPAMTEEVIQHMDGIGLTPAEIEYGCHYVRKNPQAQIDHPIVCLGRLWRDPETRRANAPVFRFCEGKKEVFLSWIVGAHYWCLDYVFLARPKQQEFDFLLSMDN